MPRRLDAEAVLDGGLDDQGHRHSLSAVMPLSDEVLGVVLQSLVFAVHRGPLPARAAARVPFRGPAQHGGIIPGR